MVMVCYIRLWAFKVLDFLGFGLWVLGLGFKVIY